ncbi:MAG: hypothetical protein E6R03_13375 [Hyphomicrobiaceae bacterium]|nr:MAG: hypothetical protein E6R03_13375 [Hyphomicrobiaceae bacterium]
MQFDPRPMTAAEAQSMIDEGATRFDYLKGRVMKISVEDLVNGDPDAFWGYDRDNGPGAGRRALGID